MGKEKSPGIRREGKKKEREKRPERQINSQKL